MPGQNVLEIYDCLKCSTNDDDNNTGLRRSSHKGKAPYGVSPKNYQEVAVDSVTSQSAITSPATSGRLQIAFVVSILIPVRIFKRLNILKGEIQVHGDRKWSRNYFRGEPQVAICSMDIQSHLICDFSITAQTISTLTVLERGTQNGLFYIRVWMVSLFASLTNRWTLV